MKILLLGGAPSVGKSETIYRLAHYLINSKRFRDVLGTVPSTFKDFKAVLDGVDKNGKRIRILINTPTDTSKIIHDFKIFHDKNGTYDILISSVRDHDFWPRDDFFKIMNINPNDPDLYEIPLAKVTRRGARKATVLTWYKNKIDRIINHTLSNNPFNI